MAETGAPRTTGRFRAWLRTWRGALIVVLVVALAAGVVGVLGGYGTRKDQRTLLDPGVAVDVGLAEIRIVDATAKLSTYSPTNWTFTVRAEVRNSSGRPITVTDFSRAVGLGYVNDAGDPIEVYSPTVAFLDGTAQSPRRVLPPGTQFQPVTFTWYATDGFQSDETLLVGLRPVTYEMNIVLGLSNDKAWVRDQSAPHFWVVTPPLQVI